mmetsp:Transcript_27983/g.66682  ORF Transcript_27983/g.66682 Transcript_27983/m.66682 type:complete len:120 (-) Transcript_27983:229-588(-)
MREVASSSNKTEPTKQFFTLSGEESCSFPEINWARVFVSITLDQSDGLKGWDAGRVPEGLSSSSLDVTQVDNFEGKREMTEEDSPVIFIATDIAFFSFCPKGEFCIGMGSSISANVQPA